MHTENVIATPGYFRALGLRLIRGRWFDERDRPGAQPLDVVSASFARRFWPGKNPLGQHIDVGFVGVVADMKLDGLNQPNACYAACCSVLPTTIHWLSRWFSWWFPQSPRWPV